MVLEKAGINPERILAKEQLLERVRYSNISLPRTQPLRSEDTPVSQRLFIVCQPSAVPEIILRDCFCRFGDLIDVYLLSGKKKQTKNPPQKPNNLNLKEKKNLIG